MIHFKFSLQWWKQIPTEVAAKYFFADQYRIHVIPKNFAITKRAIGAATPKTANKSKWSQYETRTLFRARAQAEESSQGERET